MIEHTLKLTPFSMKWLELSLKEPLQNAEDGAVWQSIARQYLDLAFRDRRGCVVTQDPRKNAIELDRVQTQQVKIEGRHFLLSFAMNFSSTLIDQIVEHEDFSRGLLVVTNLAEQDEDHIHDLLARWPKQQKDDFPVTTHELMTFNPDSEILSWINPSRPIEQIVAASQTITKSKGWRFHSEVKE